MAAYYNEFDPFAAEWLRKLIGGHIAAGDVDERSITEVRADDIKGYTQCHFFAGIGGWSLALRAAMWPDGRPVWTGSCPCQPFSLAGKGGAQSDERHLWPHWSRLISECKPPTIYGEQVAAAIGQGWLDDVAADLEAKDYACAAAVLPACSAGAFHRRDRLWFVAHSADGLHQAERTRGDVRGHENGVSADSGAMADAKGIGGSKGISEQPGQPGRRNLIISGACDGIVANAIGQRGCGGNGEGENAANVDAPGEACGGVEWVDCPDGKRRAIKSGLRLLANGVPARVGKLRAYGNAIDPRIAEKFIEATM